MFHSIEDLKHSWNRFTVKGSDRLEAEITSMIEELARMVDNAVSPSQYRAFIMLGGYGRGEGGVEVKNGKEYPHNNFDFLLVTNTRLSSRQKALRAAIIEALVPFTQKYGIGIDISTISASKLKRSRCLVIWYDMRFGHKTILGDKNFIPSLTHFSRERIPTWDVRNLLVNRGTLLVINELLLKNNSPDEKTQKTVIKHVMKAIIGYGDALLYFLGDYDWSYVERQKRMAGRQDVPKKFRHLYNEAMEFRFLPCYDKYMGRNLPAWMDELKKTLAPMHLFCEAKRLNRPDLDWDQYPHVALRHALLEDIHMPRAFIKKILNFLRSSSYPENAAFLTRMGFYTLGNQVLPILFPAVCYPWINSEFRRLSGKILQAEPESLAQAYMMRWGWVGDINLGSQLRPDTEPVIMRSVSKLPSAYYLFFRRQNSKK